MAGVRPPGPPPCRPFPACEVCVSGPSQPKDVPIEPGAAGRAQLVEFLSSGTRPPDDWKIGTEHEKFGFRTDDLRPPPFDGERGIEAVLKGLVQFGWDPVEAHGRVIALSRDGASVSLAPAGPLDPARAPLD